MQLIVVGDCDGRCEKGPDPVAHAMDQVDEVGCDGMDEVPDRERVLRSSQVHGGQGLVEKVTDEVRAAATSSEERLRGSTSNMERLGHSRRCYWDEVKRDGQRRKLLVKSLS